ncbi:PilZ domain-containing protein [Nitrospiraceae bacterium AH_259_D15_M11_P09]|nr:PilZ domain-containing protein [Nitrospiraceae bacterium AH_259_D15_M11_P09]
MDKRQAPRFKVRLPIAFLGLDLTGEGTVVNLSLEGCGIESDQNVQQGKQLTLRIFMPDQDASVVVDRAQVRWTVRGLFGLEFLTIGSEEEERLRRFLSTLETQPGP